jgi:DNA repair exonuclease SbcCD nuclease subunit
MYPKLITGIIALGVLAGSPVVWAQSWREPADPREKARDRIQMVRMLKVTEALRLDRDTAARFFAIGSRYEDTKRQVRRDMNDDIQRLRYILQNLHPPEKDLRETVNRIRNRKKDLSELTLKQIDEELSLLRPDQQARYLLFTIDFRREIDDLLREAQGEGPPERLPEKTLDRYAPRPPVEAYRESTKEKGR